MGHGYFSFPHFGFLQNGENHFQFQFFESSFFSITFRVPQIFLAAPEGSGICLPVILAAFFFATFPAFSVKAGGWNGRRGFFEFPRPIRLPLRKNYVNASIPKDKTRYYLFLKVTF